MDQTTAKIIDQTIEDDIRRGYAEVAVPPDLTAQLVEARNLDPSITVFERVRLVKATPRLKRLIGETVQKRYHQDLKDKSLLSNAQLRQLNVERGEWSDDMEKRLETLDQDVQKLMLELHIDGFDPRDNWTKQMNDQAARAQAFPEEADQDVKQRFFDVFRRWVNFTPKDRAIYTDLYAGEQELEAYSEDRDYQWLLDHAASLDAVDALNDVEELRFKLLRYNELLDKGEEKRKLADRRARMYAESVESRRDTTEELAKLYQCATVLDPAGKPVGPLANSFDALFDLPEDVLTWLLNEQAFFVNGVGPEVREYLAQWGFIRAPRSNGSAQPSGASPEVENSSADSTLAAETPAASTE